MSGSTIIRTGKCWVTMLILSLWTQMCACMHIGIRIYRNWVMCMAHDTSHMGWNTKQSHMVDICGTVVSFVLLTCRYERVTKMSDVVSEMICICKHCSSRISHYQVHGMLCRSFGLEVYVSSYSCTVTI